MRRSRLILDRQSQLRAERRRHGIRIVTPIALALPLPREAAPQTIGGCIGRALARRLAELAADYRS